MLKEPSMKQTLKPKKLTAEQFLKVKNILKAGFLKRLERKGLLKTQTSRLPRGAVWDREATEKQKAARERLKRDIDRLMVNAKAAGKKIDDYMRDDLKYDENTIDRVMKYVAAAGAWQAQSEKEGESIINEKHGSEGESINEENVKQQPQMRRILIPQAIAILMLLWALISPNDPAEYSILLRWVCCMIFAYLAFQAFFQGRKVWAEVLGITAMFYNPIIPAHLSSDFWLFINVITIVIAVLSYRSNLLNASTPLTH